MRTQHPKRRTTASRTLSVVLQLLTILSFVTVIVLAFYGIKPHWLKWGFFGTAMLLIVIQGIRLKTPLLLVDRVFANFPGKQVLLTLLIFTVSFDFALCLFPDQGLRVTFGNFISPKALTEENASSIRQGSGQQPSVPKEPAPPKHRSDYFKYGLIYVLGLIVFNGLLIATITRFMTTRAARYNMGINTYPNIKKHVVIVGYNPSCVPIIRNVCNRDKDRNPPTFLLLSSQPTDTVQRIIQTQLHAVEDHVVVYSGDMGSMTQLRRLNIPDAKEVFVLGEGQEPGRDSMNLECARLIKELRKEGRNKTILPVNIQFDKPGSYSTIKRITIPNQYYENDKSEEVTYFHPFNFYENWARLLWGYHRLEAYHSLDRGKMVELRNGSQPLPSQKHVHLVIAGFNEMGTALLLEALRICHYPNFDETTGANKTRITVIDPKMDLLLPRFQSQYPYLQQITDVEIDYRADRIEDNRSRAFLNELAGQTDTVLTVAICFTDADNSLSAALTLPESLYYHVVNGQIIPHGDAEILVRQEIKSGLSDVLDKENGKFANVKIFGTIDKGVDDRLLDDTMAILINALYHFKYGCNPPKDFFQRVEEDRGKALSEAAKAWIALNEDMRFANRYQTEIYKTYQTYRPLLDHQPELLFQTEHLRWCAERSITGYRNLPEPQLKSNAYQIHHLIVPYHALSDHEKKKDKDVLLIMDKIIELAGSIPGNLF